MTSIERMVSTALRTGVILAALIAGAGGVAYLVVHGSEPASFAAPSPVHPLGPSERIIALGVLVMIATPVVRVALLAFAFARQRDAVFACLSALVLSVLLATLL
ncbi:MAG TPA: DUF1634 domain-containing protein [Gemmatimonadaceae bacterium]|jgi:uncharacterized membrane protein|nr:DUF1634 domain-containing protein [Gemmatimonadaceae bacterium]